MDFVEKLLGTGSAKIMRRYLSVVITLLAIAGVSRSQAKDRADLIITDGTVVTMDGSRTIVDHGAIAILGDTIVAIGPRQELENKYHFTKSIDATDMLVLPGFINGHTHVPMTLFRG